MAERLNSNYPLNCHHSEILLKEIVTTVSIQGSTVTVYKCLPGVHVISPPVWFNCAQYTCGTMACDSGPLTACEYYLVAQVDDC